MRHEKSLGRYCGGGRFSFGTPRTNPPPVTPNPQYRCAALGVRSSGDIIIRYERVYEAANHDSFHISNVRWSLFSLMVAIFEFSIPPLRHNVRTKSNIFCNPLNAFGIHQEKYQTMPRVLPLIKRHERKIRMILQLMILRNSRG